MGPINFPLPISPRRSLYLSCSHFAGRVRGLPIFLSTIIISNPPNGNLEADALGPFFFMRRKFVQRPSFFAAPVFWPFVFEKFINCLTNEFGHRNPLVGRPEREQPPASNSSFPAL